MSVLIGIAICIQFSASPDTLRKDGYYIEVSEGSANWHIEYYSPDGYFVDTSGHGTAPVLEKALFPSTSNIVYTVEKEKEGFTIRYEDLNLPPYHTSSLPSEMKCKFENGDLVVLAFRNNLEKRWKKVKSRYYFIPF